MIPALDEYQKRARSFILQAQQLYLTSDEGEETTSEQCCENALRVLEACDDGIAKSLLACEANIWLFVSILKRLRLLHVELDPLNSSDDLFAPAAPRDAFVPKPLEKLCAKSFRDGFSRLDAAHQEAYRAWTEGIMPRFSSLKAAPEVRAAVNITTKLASISLLSSHPLSALNVFLHLWKWTKCEPALRFLTTLLVAFGFVNSAVQHFESNLASNLLSHLKLDKYGIEVMMEQIKRLPSLCASQADNNTGSRKDSETLPKKFPISVRCRLESLTAFVDCFVIQQPQSGSAAIERRSPIAAITRARQCATQLFFMQNQMETCATLPCLEDVQHFVDTFWYLQMLLNEALMQQRSGKIDSAARLLFEGYSIASVLCSPYWLVKFTTHLAYLDLLTAISDPENDLDLRSRLAFVRSIFSLDEKNRSATTATDARSVSNRTPMKKAKVPAGTDRTSSDVMAVELSRRMETERLTSVRNNAPRECKDVQLKSAVQLSSPGSSSVYCDCCNYLKELDELFFHAVVPCDTSSDISSADLKERCLAVLRSHLSPKPTKLCSHHDSTPFDDNEITAFLNEPLWNFLEFYLLLSSIQNDGCHVYSEEVTMLEKALGLLNSASSTLFSLYYRLTFSLSLAQRKLAQLLSADSQPNVTDLLSQLQLDDGKENKPKRGRRKKAMVPDHNSPMVNKDLKVVIAGVTSDVERYMHLQYYPWYRWSRQLIGVLHLPSVAARLHLDTVSAWSSLSTINFLEASSVSFRHSVTAKESTAAAAKLCQFRDEKSLKEALSKLPSDWTVISLQIVTILSNRRLILSRLSGRCQPIVVDLGDVVSQYDAASIFASFLQEVDESIKIKEKKQFWSRRYALETKIAAILEYVETEWFGCFRALLRGFSGEMVAAFKKKHGIKDSVALECLLPAIGVLDKAERNRYLSEVLSLSSQRMEKFLDFMQEPLPETSDCGPVFLILDKELYGIPWENMQILRGKPVCRTPCLQYLVRSVSLYQQPKLVSKDRVFYIVNPSEDLKPTEEFFKWFSSIKGWSGLCGNQPDLTAMKEALESNDIYIYCGHNSGVKCLNSGRRIEQLVCKSSVVLMGCGSGKAVCHGPLFEPDTVPFNYLVADSPSVVGCLWSITAPDIDRYLAQVLKLWLKVVPPTDSAKDKISGIGSLLHAIAQSKSVCKLPLLTGAAVVSFGLPVFCD